MKAVQLTMSESPAPKPKGLRFCIDWLAFTVKSSPAEPIIVLITKLFGDEWGRWSAIQRGDRWEKMAGPYNSLLQVNWKERWVHVQLKGSTCTVLGTEKVIALHDVLHARYGSAYRVTRVDLAWDDYSKRITPAQFRRRFWDQKKVRKCPEVVSRAKKGHSVEDDAPEKGSSYRVGERCSNRMLRVYDKCAESNGEIDAIRFELECKDRVARQAMAAVSSSMGNRSAGALRFLVGFVDFRMDPGKPLKKRARCRWWARFVGGATSAELQPAERGSLDEWRLGFTRQNSSAFRLLVALRDGDVSAAAGELMSANPRDNPRHERWRREHRASQAGGA